MGVNDSTPTPRSNNNTTFAHPRFRNARCFQKNDQLQFLEINCSLPNQEQYRNWEIFMNSAPKIDSLMLPIDSHFEKSPFCGSVGIAKIAYPNYQFLLTEEINNRSKLKKFLFDQSQLWYLAYTIIEAAQAIHAQGYKVGDIRPNNIFINQQGQIKLGCIYSWPGQSTNYSKTYNEKQITYLAPEEIKDIQFAKIDHNPNFQLAQSFSIGLTMLDAAILSNSQKLYEHKSRFDFEALQKNLIILREKGYSESLIILIENLCDPEPLNRSICKNLKQWLKPYEQAIISLSPFQIEEVPQNLQRSHKRMSNLIKNSQNTSIVERIDKKIEGITLRSNSPIVIKQHIANKQSKFYETQLVQPKLIMPLSSFQKWSQNSSPFSPPNNNKRQKNNNYNPSTISNFSQSPSSFTIQINSNTQRILSLQQIDRQLEISRKMFPS